MLVRSCRHRLHALHTGPEKLLSRIRVFLFLRWIAPNKVDELAKKKVAILASALFMLSTFTYAGACRHLSEDHSVRDRTRPAQPCAGSGLVPRRECRHRARVWKRVPQLSSNCHQVFPDRTKRIGDWHLLPAVRSRYGYRIVCSGDRCFRHEFQLDVHDVFLDRRVCGRRVRQSASSVGEQKATQGKRASAVFRVRRGGSYYTRQAPVL